MIKKFSDFLDEPKNRLVLWILTGIIIFLVGVLSPKADTYDVTQFSAQLYDNVNGSLSSVTTSYDSSMGIYYGYVSWSGSNASGGAWGVSSPIPLIANHTYSMTVSVPVSGCGTTTLSSYNRIGVGTSLSGAVSSYQSNSYVSENYSKAVNNYLIQFVFTPSINGSYIVFPYASSSSCNGPASHLETIAIDDLGSGGVSQTDITNSLNNQTSTINQTITSSENNVKNNSNNNRDLIIQNQNENTSSQIVSEGNNARQQEVNSCSNAYMFNLKKGYTISSSNSLVSNSDAFYTEEYISIHSNVTQLTIKNSVRTSGYYILVYNTSKTLLDYWYTEDGRIVNLPSGSAYFRLSSTNANVMVYDGNKGCINRIGAIDDTLNDDSIDNDSASSFFDDFTVNDNGGISSIVSAPLVAIEQMLSGTCSPMTATWHGKEISLPCGTDFWNRISAIRSFLNVTLGGLLCYRIILKIFKLVEGFKNPENDKVEVMNL